MKLYNTLSRSLEDFKSIKDGQVTLYTCGPTVYSYYHIGNLRNAVFNDTLRRSLQLHNYSVKHVMNITDVGHLASDNDEGEDKLEKGARTERKTVWEVADYYIKAFIADMKQLNVLEPNGYKGPNQPYARATDFINQQQAIIQILLAKDYAYQTEQAIYFDVSKLADYGKLTGQPLADKEVAVRAEVVTDATKHHPQDFALWFFKTGRFAHHSMSWDSPWGTGFPGWHLECSAIVHATLGEPIDIHTGGVDHIGTHHTNEIAQTEAAYGVKLANYWLHNEHLLINNQRMAKSASNFYTLDDVIKKDYPPLALRLLFLQAHYRSQMNFTWAALDGAAQLLNNLQAWADSSKQPSVPAFSQAQAQNLLTDVKQALGADLNTATALAAINAYVDKLAPTEDLLTRLDDIFGLSLAGRPDISDGQKQLIEQRRQARESKNWAAADQIRDQLLKQAIELSDTGYGQVWRRV